MLVQAAILEGQHDEQDASNAVYSSAKGSDHCRKMRTSLNRQFQPQVAFEVEVSMLLSLVVVLAVLLLLLLVCLMKGIGAASLENSV